VSTALPAPPSPFLPAPNLFQLEPLSVLDRVFHPDYAPNSFNPGRGAPTRFAPIRDRDGKLVSTLYAGGTRECSFQERLFHDVPLTSTLRTVDFKVIAPLAYCSLRVIRPLSLAMLFAPDLALWGLSRTQLIESFSETYLQTARWAEAIHHAFPNIDGLTWSSRLCEPAPSVMFFGDRVHPTDLEVVGEPRLIRKDAELIKDLGRFARRTGITILNPPFPSL
jgi:hypothetical protein